MSRSLGDAKAKKLGVISEPIIRTYPLIEVEGFIILASDGVWDVLSNEEVADIVGNMRK